MKLLITGGAGFIGSALVRQALAAGHRVVTVDALNYAAHPQTVAHLRRLPGHVLEVANICDGPALAQIFARHRPDAVMHLAAQSHVDRSITGPTPFIETNITGTFHLLEAALAYWQGAGRPAGFRLHHISTDEVFGSLGPRGQFSETSAYAPNSPYSASKAASDHLVRAWGETYGLPVLISHCSNNYGPYQCPEKLIPLVIARALAGQDIPIYGAGENVRDWLYVDDHVLALLTILTRAQVGAHYVIGGNCEQRNIDLVGLICTLLDQKRPKLGSYRGQIIHVADRLGHDARYAVDARRLQVDLGWRPQTPLRVGLAKTIDWYLAHPSWGQTPPLSDAA